MTTAKKFSFLIIWASLAHADPTSEARTHYRRGLTLFNEKKFTAAEEEFEAGYQLQPLPLFLFNAAQAARRAGHSTRALELYKKFVAGDPQSSQREEAERRILELEPASPSQVAPSPAPPPPQLLIAPPPEKPHWSRDPAAGALVGIGLAALAGGAIVLGIGGARLANAQSSYDSFDSAHNSQPLFIGGGITLGIGAALVLGGAIRYAMVRRASRSSPEADRRSPARSWSR
jgi:tetratricopeptide (TPR) repeat protein